MIVSLDEMTETLLPDEGGKLHSFWICQTCHLYWEKKSENCEGRIKIFQKEWGSTAREGTRYLFWSVFLKFSLQIQGNYFSRAKIIWRYIFRITVTYSLQGIKVGRETRRLLEGHILISNRWQSMFGTWLWFSRAIRSVGQIYIMSCGVRSWEL